MRTCANDPGQTHYTGCDCHEQRRDELYGDLKDDYEDTVRELSRVQDELYYIRETLEAERMAWSIRACELQVEVDSLRGKLCC